MKFIFHPDAEAEFHEAIEYYEEWQQGLGNEFAFEIQTSIQRIISHPLAWPILEEDIRRYLVNRFPYGILYTIEPDGIFILAIMHLHRDPEYWKYR